MLYIKTLQNITQHELQAVGYKAQDLALVASQQIQTPSSFVILSTVFDEMVRRNNLRYKMDYILGRAQATIPSTITNAHGAVRKAFFDAQFPSGFETELREMYESITTPLTIGELATQRPPARIIISMNRIDNPENNDTIIRNIRSFEDLVVQVREAWALAYHPNLLLQRVQERYPETQLKIALIVQAVDDADTTTHAYSAVRQDHKKVYMQVYYGYPDLGEEVTKDYYAVAKDSMRIVARQVRQQPRMIALDEKKELGLVALDRPASDKMVERDTLEIARLAKKIERLLQTPVKAFFTSKNETHEILWINRLGFDIMLPSNSQEDFIAESSSHL